MSLEHELQPNFCGNLKTKMHKIMKNDELLDNREIEWKSDILVKISHFLSDFHQNERFPWKSHISVKIPQKNVRCSPKCLIVTPFLYLLKVNHFSKFWAFLFWDFQKKKLATTQVLKTSMWSMSTCFKP